jgi:hypothetical protein
MSVSEVVKDRADELLVLLRKPMGTNLCLDQYCLRLRIIHCRSSRCPLCAGLNWHAFSTTRRFESSAIAMKTLANKQIVLLLIVPHLQGRRFCRPARESAIYGCVSALNESSLGHTLQWQTLFSPELLSTCSGMRKSSGQIWSRVGL